MIKNENTELIIEELIGEGGMGYVYKAHLVSPSGFKKIVAAKKLKSNSDKSVMEALLHEANLASKLNHPRIAQVYDIRTINNEIYIVYEFVQGKTLRELLDERIRKNIIYNEVTIIYLIKEVCEVIHYANELGVVHRDLSPSNLMMGQSGEIKVIDFGIALDYSADLIQEKTKSLVGNFQYFAPERIEGNSATAQSDIYSLGLIAYEMWKLHSPFKANSDLKTISSIKTKSEELYKFLTSETSEFSGFSTILSKMLNPDPKLRIRSLDLLDQAEILLKKSSLKTSVILDELNNKKMPPFNFPQTIRVESVSSSTSHKDMKKSFKVILFILGFSIIFGLIFGFRDKFFSNNNAFVVKTKMGETFPLNENDKELFVSQQLSTLTCDIVFRNLLSFPMLMFDPESRENYLKSGKKRTISQAVKEILMYEKKRKPKVDIVFEKCQNISNKKAVESYYYVLLNILKTVLPLMTENELKNIQILEQNKWKDPEIYNNIFSSYYPGYLTDAQKVLSAGDLLNQNVGESFQNTELHLVNNIELESAQSCANIIDRVWSYYALYSEEPKPSPEERVKIYLFPFGSKAKILKVNGELEGIHVEAMEDPLFKNGFCIYERSNITDLKVTFYKQVRVN